MDARPQQSDLFLVHKQLDLELSYDPVFVLVAGCGSLDPAHFIVILLFRFGSGDRTDFLSIILDSE